MTGHAAADEEPEGAVLDRLLAAGALTLEQREQAVREAAMKRCGALALLVDRGILREGQVTDALGQQLGLPVWRGPADEIDPALWELAAPAVWLAGPLLPLSLRGEILTFAAASAPGVAQGLDVANGWRKQAQFQLSPASHLQAILRDRLDAHATVESLWELGEAEFSADLDALAADANADDPGSPIVRFVDHTIAQAVREGASDIHIEPLERRLRVRFRVDGVMYDVYSPPKSLEPAVMTRLKLMAGLNIAERRRPQDGRIRVRFAARTVDIRISFIPAAAGERTVLRLLDPETSLRAIAQLGLGELERPFTNLLNRSQGILLVTGPTGSGKTTTLYAGLNYLNRPGHNIISIEDPVEYRLEGVNQLAVNRATGFTFAAGLRSILRQDPDIILVGEIRDQETAAISIQAAMTGHLVLSTLHTNDATSAVSRLIDMEIEPFRIAETLAGALGQRLVRAVCHACRQAYQPDADVLRHFQDCRNAGEVKAFVRGAGCPACRGTGFRGRTGIFELLDVGADVAQLIREPESAGALRPLMLDKGMRTLEEDGWQKVALGATTPDELLRVVRNR